MIGGEHQRAGFSASKEFLAHRVELVSIRRRGDDGADLRELLVGRVGGGGWLGSGRDRCTSGSGWRNRAGRFFGRRRYWLRVFINRRRLLRGFRAERFRSSRCRGLLGFGLSLRSSLLPRRLQNVSLHFLAPRTLDRDRHRLGQTRRAKHPNSPRLLAAKLDVGIEVNRDELIDPRLVVGAVDGGNERGVRLAADHLAGAAAVQVCQDGLGNHRALVILQLFGAEFLYANSEGTGKRDPFQEARRVQLFKMRHRILLLLWFPTLHRQT